MNEEIKVKAQMIADRLNDPKGIWFHYKYVLILGFQKCYELTSLAIQEYKAGKVKTSIRQYYNGCVMREIQKKGGYRLRHA